MGKGSAKPFLGKLSGETSSRKRKKTKTILPKHHLKSVKSFEWTLSCALEK